MKILTKSRRERENGVEIGVVDARIEFHNLSLREKFFHEREANDFSGAIGRALEAL